MKDKDEDDISWLLLWGATIFYIAVLCMAFAGLVALGGHGKSVVAIFTSFMQDYGSLLAGIPVLIAIWVAKEQIEASRKQHIATIKRSFRHEIDTLDRLEGLISSIKNYKDSRAYKITSKTDPKIFPFIRAPTHELNNWPESIPLDIKSICLNMIDECHRAHLVSQDNSKSALEIEGAIKSAIFFANYLNERVQFHKQHLSQYWS